MAKESIFERRQRRTRFQLRKKANGKPRLSVFRSGKHIYAQLIDDANGVILAAASTVDKEVRGKLKGGGSTKDAAKLVGELIAARASKAKVTDVVFDRGGYLYHGRVASLAEAARAGGLKF